MGKMIKIYATKRQGSIAPYALIRTRKFIIVIGFPGLIQRQGLASWTLPAKYHISALIEILILYCFC